MPVTSPPSTGLPGPETTLAGFDLRKHRREDVTPVGRVCRIVTRRRGLWFRMDVVTGVVTRRMSIPPMIERPRLMTFVIVKREIPGFEPDNLQTGTPNPLRVEVPLVLTDQSVGREARLVIDFGEPIVCRETLSNDR